MTADGVDIRGKSEGRFHRVYTGRYHENRCSENKRDVVEPVGIRSSEPFPMVNQSGLPPGAR